MGKSFISTKNVALDVKDAKLLALLREDARMPISTLAKRLALNRDTVNYRMRRLEEQGVITHYYAEIDRSVYGQLICHVFMLLDETDQKRQQSLLAELIAHPNTEALFEYNDRWDVQWVLVAPSLEELDDIIMRFSTKYSGVILEKDTLVVVRWSRAAVWDQQDPNARIDETDTAILRDLAKDCRSNAVTIGHNVGLSSDAIILRIRRLKDHGIIRRFTTRTNPQRLGRQQYTMMVQMKQFDEHKQRLLKAFTKDHAQVLRCVKTIGTWDIMLSIVVQEPGEFHSIVKEIKQQFSDCIKSYESYLVYRETFISSFPQSISAKEKTQTTTELPPTPKKTIAKKRARTR